MAFRVSIERSWLDMKHTIFGRMADGLESYRVRAFLIAHLGSLFTKQIISTGLGGNPSFFRGIVGR